MVTERSVAFNKWFITSAVLAVVAFCYGPLQLMFVITFFSSNAVPTSDTIAYAIWLGWLWIASFIIAAIKIRWRALWLVIAAPFALYYPALWIFRAHACDLLGRCHSFFGLISNDF